MVQAAQASPEPQVPGARGQGGAVTLHRTLPLVLPLSAARPSPPRPSGLPGVLPRQGLGAVAQASDSLILDLSCSAWDVLGPVLPSSLGPCEEELSPRKPEH